MPFEAPLLADLQVVLLSSFEQGRSAPRGLVARKSRLDDVFAAAKRAEEVFASVGEQPPAPPTTRARLSGQVISWMRQGLFWLFPQVTRSDAAVLDVALRLARAVQENDAEIRRLAARIASLESSAEEGAASQEHIDQEISVSGMVTRQDVIYAYRLILGREPENEQVIQDHLDLPNLAALRERFIAAPEFVSMRIPVQANPMAKVARHDIQVDAGDKLKLLLDRVYRAWSRLGEDDPFYSVLTFDRFHQDQIAENMDEFYSSGLRDIERLALCLQRNAVKANIRQVVELGCGVGRLTDLLAERFPSVIGLDVSKPHLELARQHCEKQKRRNVELRQVRSMADIESLPEIDLFFTLIVLQHNPPPVIVAILERIASKIAPGGLMYFQVPTYLPGYRFRVQEYLDSPETSTIEMHAVPQHTILRLLADAGLQLIEIVEDDCTGIQGAISNTFLAQKPAP
jgi:SAM-dependent methyltransferase